MRPHLNPQLEYSSVNEYFGYIDGGLCPLFIINLIINGDEAFSDINKNDDHN